MFLYPVHVISAINALKSLYIVNTSFENQLRRLRIAFSLTNENCAGHRPTEFGSHSSGAMPEADPGGRGAGRVRPVKSSHKKDGRQVRRLLAPTLQNFWISYCMRRSIQIHG